MRTTRALLGIASIVTLVFSSGQAAFAGVGDWQKGASVSPSWNGDFASDAFKQSLRDLKAMNANYVTLIIPYTQSNLWSTDIGNAWNTPTDESLAAGIDYAHSIGLAVNIKPHLDSGDGQWRAYIDPSDRTTWFNNYENNILLPLARMGAAHGVEEMTLGTELAKMASTSNPTNTQNWQKMIRDVRGAFGGKLTYSSQHDNPDEKSQIDFWGDLDYIGVSAYHPSGLGETDPSVEQLRSEWDSWWWNSVNPLSQRFGNKPVVYTEIGFRSVDGAHQEPAAYWRNGGYDPQEQVNDYTALVQAQQDKSNFQGLQIWDWKSDPNAGGQWNTDFTVQNKPAEDTLRALFANSTPTSSSSSSSSVGPGSSTYTVNASAAPASVTIGQNVATTVNVTNTANIGGNGVVVDIEIYNQNGSQMKQQFSDNQSFAPNQTKTYTLNWAPTANGQYVVKVGIFGPGWNPLYLWSDSVATFVAGQSSSSSSSTSTSSSSSSSSSSSTSSSSSSSVAALSGPIDIWWVTDGQRVSGEQPFKARLAVGDLSQYNLYWTVDGGGENLMGNSNVDYPHKEQLVNVDYWTWRGNEGNYTVTYVARDLNGIEIARRSETITAVHY